MYDLHKALAKHSSPEFEAWWDAPSENHKGRGMVGGTVETNGDFVMSLWSNPWMKAHAAEIFNAGLNATKLGK